MRRRFGRRTVNQRIDGNNNVQIRDVEGDINVFQGREFDANNANLIPCPACSRPLSYQADECPDCGAA